MTNAWTGVHACCSAGSLLRRGNPIRTSQNVAMKATALTTAAILALTCLGLLGCESRGSPGPQFAMGLAISPDGSKIVVGGHNHLVVAKVDSVDPALKIHGSFNHGSVLAPRFDPTGRFIFFWSAESFQLDLETGTSEVISESVDSSLISAEVTSDDGRYRIGSQGLLDNVSNKPLLSYFSTSISASADFDYICVPTDEGGDLQIQLFRMQEGHVLPLRKKKVDGYGSIAGTAVEGNPPIIVYLDGVGGAFLLRGEVLKQESLATSINRPSDAAITPDGRTIVLLGDSGGIEALESATGKSLSAVSSERIRFGKISANGKLLAVIDDRDHLFLYSIPELTKVFDVNLHSTLEKFEKPSELPPL